MRKLPTKYRLLTIAAASSTAVLLAVGIALLLPNSSSKSATDVALPPAAPLSMTTPGGETTATALTDSTCATGDFAINPTSESGVELPRSESFNTVEAAESFVCFKMVRPRDLGTLIFLGATANRSRSLAVPEDGSSFSLVTLVYSVNRGSQGLRLNISNAELTAPGGAFEEITIAGQAAHLVRNGDPSEIVSVTWQQDGLSYLATAHLGGEFNLDDLLRVLDTSR